MPKNKNRRRNRPAEQPVPVTSDAQTALDTYRNQILPGAREIGETYRDLIPEGSFGRQQGGITPEMQAYLNRLNDFSNQAQGYTGLENEALEAMRSGMAGYEGPEVQAMREAGMQELNRNYQTGMRQQMMNQARSGVRGAAAGAQLANLGATRVQTAGNLERDLIIKQADEVQRRRQAFADLVGQTEAGRFARGQGALGMEGSARSGEEAVQRGIDEFNIGQQQNEALQRAGIVLGGTGQALGGIQGIMAGNQQQDWFNQQMRMNRQNNQNQRRAFQTVI